MNEQAKKVALRKIPYGAYVVGCRQGEELNAFTVTWLSQCSFEPPMVMMAVRVDSRSHDMIQSDRVFSVSFLSTDQKEIAATFFKPPQREGNRFGDIPFHLGVTGTPILDDAIAAIECEVRVFIEEGDHHVVIAEVVEAEGDPDRWDAPVLTCESAGWHYGG